MVRAVRPALLALLALVGPGLSAHPEIDDALARLNTAIAAAPADAELYLQRGELYAKHEDFVAAEANFLRAGELAPALPRLDRARAALALAARQPAEARALLDHALRRDPRDAEALILRSRSRAALNDRPGALGDLESALRLLPHPHAGLFLERAALLSTPAAAVRSLDEAMTRIGPVHVLQLRALELEEHSGQLDAALSRLVTLAAQSERPELWLKRRGDVLRRAGRTTEARAAYRDALAAIATLPDWLRQSPDTRQLTLELNSSS